MRYRCRAFPPFDWIACGNAGEPIFSRIGMTRITMLTSLVPKADGRTIAREPKRADSFYGTDEHRRFREHVLARAGYQCEWVEDGQRCTKAGPKHRMFADHIKELQDGGDPYDPDNGQCFCGGHHTKKTALARAARLITPQGKGMGV